MYAFFSALEKVDLQDDQHGYREALRSGDLPFLPHLDVAGVALFVLRGLLSGLIELLVDCSATSHEVLLDTTQASEDVVNMVEGSLFELRSVVGKRIPHGQRQK